MVGQVLGAVGGLPQIFTELEVSYYLLKRLLGVRTEGDKKGFSRIKAFNECSGDIMRNQYIINMYGFLFLVCVCVCCSTCENKMAKKKNPA